MRLPRSALGGHVRRAASAAEPQGSNRERQPQPASATGLIGYSVAGSNVSYRKPLKTLYIVNPEATVPSKMGSKSSCFGIDLEQYGYHVRSGSTQYIIVDLHPGPIALEGNI